MKNLHLMWMNSNFNQRLVRVLNEHFSQDDNCYVWRTSRTFPEGVNNCILDPTMFSPEAINRLSSEWDQIILHSLYLSDRELLRLSEDAAHKIVWVVWGHDLYKRIEKPKHKLRSILYCSYKWMQAYSPFFYFHRKKVANVVRQFRSIAIGFPYDEKYIRKKFGKTVPVVYGPYFSKNTDKTQAEQLRLLHMSENHSGINILIGHCGADYIQHEKYLRKLAKYKCESIHIYLIMSYLATPERISKIRSLAGSIYSEDQFTIITDTMPQDEYFMFLTKMDIAIFPFNHQAALGNTKRLAYMGVKVYFDPKGVLSRGFKSGGVQTFNCKQIGRIPFSVFSQTAPLPDKDAPLFDTLIYEKNVTAWDKILNGELVR